tara:strand:- start:19082 stop:19342 length:261 start_codon:yes stop_codon:yes gene_type:complete
MIIEIILTIIIITLGITLFYALRRINQYEDIIVDFQNIIRFASEKMKQVDSAGHYESDDETGFFFEEIKKLQILLDSLFETEQEKK